MQRAGWDLWMGFLVYGEGVACLCGWIERVGEMGREKFVGVEVEVEVEGLVWIWI